MVELRAVEDLEDDDLLQAMECIRMAVTITVAELHGGASAGDSAEETAEVTRLTGLRFGGRDQARARRPAKRP